MVRYHLLYTKSWSNIIQKNRWTVLYTHGHMKGEIILSIRLTTVYQNSLGSRVSHRRHPSLTSLRGQTTVVCTLNLYFSPDLILFKGLSLSPQPSEFLGALSFDYSTTSDFPSTSTLPLSLPPLSHSPKSHSPSPSLSSVDPMDAIVKHSKSRDGSPSRTPENDARRRFPCLIIGCERRFTSQYTLKVHMEAHKPKPRVSFPCTLGCNERFSRQHDRLRHEVAKHGKVCEFSCEECGRFFSTKKTLGNHKCPVAQGGTRWVTS